MKAPGAKLTRVARCIYRDDKTRSLFHSVKLNGSKYPTKRKLTATTITKAIEEVAALKVRAREATLGLANDPYEKPRGIGDLSQRWVKAGCPGRDGRERTGNSLDEQKGFLKRLLPFWKHRQVPGVTPKTCREYHAWRTRRNKKQFRLGRTVDREIDTVRNVLDWAVDEEIIDFNPLAKVKRFDNPKLVRHCTKVMPRSDEEFHLVAKLLLDMDRSRPMGWQCLLEGLTGARTSEILACRTDAEAPRKPGYYDAHALHVHRCKDGIEPWALLQAAPGHDPLRACLSAFLNWHHIRYPHSPWFIPGIDPQQRAGRHSLTHALHRACDELGIPLITSHGLRAYNVHTLRSLGIPDNEIAIRLGHRSTAQVENTYGKCEPGWFGSKKQDFLPEGFSPAWTLWVPPQSADILELKTYQNLIPHDKTDRAVPKPANPPDARNRQTNRPEYPFPNLPTLIRKSL